MQVKEIMTANVEAVKPDDTLQMAADRMRAANVGFLAVIGNGKAMGVITDRDIAVRATAEGRNPSVTQVKEFMTPQAIRCHQTSDVNEAAHIMENRQVRRLLVDDEMGRIVGVVSLGDIAVGAPQDLAAEILREVSAMPSHV